MKHASTIARATAATVAALLLAGCTPEPPTIKALAREVTPADTLPDGVVMGKLTEADLQGVRLLATKDGIRHFVGQAQDSQVTCLSAYPDDRPSMWFTGCGELRSTDREIINVGMNGVGSAILVPDNFTAQEILDAGYERIHENIFVAGNAGRIPGA